MIDTCPTIQTPADRPAQPVWRCWGWVALALVAVVHALSATFHVLTGALNVDEGFYAAACRSAAHGEWPYRDFGYSQTPLLPFINGALMRLWGFGLFPQRMTNALWVACALAISVWLVARRARLGLGLALALSFSLLAPWMHWVHLGKTYALSTVIMVAASAVFLQAQADHRRQGALSLLAAIGIGTRLSLLPFFAVLWLAACFEGCRAKWPRAVAGLFLCTMLVFLPFAVASPEGFIFWIFKFHAAGSAARGFPVRVSDLLSLAPALGLSAAVVLLARRGPTARRERMLLYAALAGMATNLAVPGAYTEYAAPLLLPMAIAVVLLAEMRLRDWSVSRRRLFVLLLLLAQGTAAPLGNLLLLGGRQNLPSWWLTPSERDYDFQLRERHARIRQVVDRFLPAGQPLFGPNLLPALDLGRPVPALLTMGPFSVTRELPVEQAHRLGLATDDDLLALVSDPGVTVISFADRAELNYGWSMPSFARLPAGATPRWSEIVLRDFHPVMRVRNYVILVRRSLLVRPATRT